MMQATILRSLPRVAGLSMRSGSPLYACAQPSALLRRGFRVSALDKQEESEGGDTMPVRRQGGGKGMMGRRGGGGGSALAPTTFGVRSPLFADMEREMESLMKSFGMASPLTRFGGGLDEMTKELNLAVDVKDEKDRYVIHADVPGMRKEDVKISLSPDHRVLTISGERKYEERQEGEGGIIRMERSMGSFSRSFGLPEHVDAHNIKAKMKNGVLEMSLPKTSKDEPEEKTINIEFEEE